MLAALRGSYVEFVKFMGITEKYPLWFERELSECIYMDEDRFTYWSTGSDAPYYREEKLVEEYSIFLRKPNGEVHVTDYDTFQDLYTIFRFDVFTHSGIAALEDDCIEYVECKPGILSAGYPLWFYEYFTEAFNYPQDEKTLFIYDSSRQTLKASRESLEATAGDGVMVTDHCVFLYNRYGEIRGMLYDDFIKYYDDDPRIGGIWLDY
jgi:hypothetical protein